MHLSEDHRAIQDAVRSYVQDRIAPQAAQWDKAHHFPKAELQGLAELGCYGVAVPDAYGGAGLVSSARDYDRFLHMLANGGSLDGRRVMKTETAALAMSNLLPPGVTFGGIGEGTGGAMSARMGFGAGGSVYLENAPGGTPSKGTFGWGGAAGTIAWVDPVKKARGTVMVQYFPAEQWGLRQSVPAALARDLQRLTAR